MKGGTENVIKIFSMEEILEKFHRSQTTNVWRLGTGNLQQTILLKEC